MSALMGVNRVSHVFCFFILFFCSDFVSLFFGFVSGSCPRCECVGSIEWIAVWVVWMFVTYSVRFVTANKPHWFLQWPFSVFYFCCAFSEVATSLNTLMHHFRGAMQDKVTEHIPMTFPSLIWERPSDSILHWTPLWPVGLNALWTRVQVGIFYW